MDSSDFDPNKIHGFLGPLESSPKRHLDRCIRFAGLMNLTNGQTDRQTDRQTELTTALHL